MKHYHYLCLLLMMSSLGLLLGGCVIKPAGVPTRHFILAPIPLPEHAPTTAQPMAIEVGFVQMPSYLLRDSMVVRQSADEVYYLDTALWAERLDRSFRATLAKNLVLLMAADPAGFSSPERHHSELRVSVHVEQFDVASGGQGTLRAEWRLTAGGADKPMKIGQTHLTKLGPSPRGNPQAIATTLSGLVAEFSRDLALALRESDQAIALYFPLFGTDICLTCTNSAATSRLPPLADYLNGNLSPHAGPPCINAGTAAGVLHGGGQSILTAVCVPSQYYLGSAMVDIKTNEIPVAQKLFPDLDLKGRFVSLDARHTQTQTARDIVLEGGGDYLLTVKDNQQKLRQNIEKLLPAPKADPLGSRRPRSIAPSSTRRRAVM